MELMGSVGWNLDCVPSPDGTLFSSKRRLQLTLENNKTLLEIMAVRRRSTSRRNVHVDQAELTSGVTSRQKNRVRIAYNSEMYSFVIVRILNC